ncbi:uncharacterized protein LOC113860049 isoform X3 [Abrus precatorius]|uniref:Uncharacterized protein LOC113860049 isoform X3 n=1 Tax=Abrus precatorius TaxID=3816 RepID=A0A8B8KWX7_ABRPR|nr:uncharacterized protein LOC113860049 isoform X3 [Abrus precatorius]
MLEYDNCYMLCFPIFMTCQMSQDSRSLIASDKYERVGPDYFGYYSSEVLNLLSQDEGDFTVSTQTSEELPQNKYGEGINKNLVNHSDNCSGPLYSNGVGDGLSDFRKDRLRSLLRQSVIALSSEVDEVVDPVFATSHLQSKLRSKTHSLNPTEIASDDEVQIPCKLLKLSSSSPSASFLAQTRNVNPQCSTKVYDDLQFLLENDSVEVEEMVKKYSNDLSKTLGYMEQRLELLLDAIMLKCRSMTLAEKQQLQRLIQKLPAGNLDRVAEIICRNRQVEERSCDEIFVDLEKEDNATLWRLYYYVEAVEKAKSLSSCEEA